MAAQILDQQHPIQLFMFAIFFFVMVSQKTKKGYQRDIPAVL